MKLLVDMNLSPAWLPVLESHGWQTRHWSQVGDPRSTDEEIMRWAHENGYVIFTHDLDFGALLAVTRAAGPSVIQVRTQDVAPEAIESLVVEVLNRHGLLLEEGALLVVDEAKSRVRILPLVR